MKKPHEIVSFTRKSLVAGAPSGHQGYWKKDRRIQGPEVDMNEIGEVLARLSGELIEQVVWLQSPEHTRVAIQRRISQIMGALRREKDLLDELVDAGFDIHPLLSELLIRRAQERLSRRRRG
jgi:hypothetical protein